MTRVTVIPYTTLADTASITKIYFRTTFSTVRAVGSRLYGTFGTHTAVLTDFHTFITAVTLDTNILSIRFANQTLSTVRAMTAVVHGTFLAHVAILTESCSTVLTEIADDTMIFITVYVAGTAIRASRIIVKMALPADFTGAKSQFTLAGTAATTVT